MQRYSGWRGRLAMGLVIGFSAGCASTGATFRSGVGDTYLEHPPWYGGVSESVVRQDGTRVGHLPIVFQRGATQPAFFDPSDEDGSPTAVLLREMNAYLDSLTAAHGASIRLVEGGRISAVASRATEVPPDVQFGCIPELGDPWNECAEREDGGALGRGRQQMRLTVGRPSREWIGWIADVMRDQGVGRTLVLSLEVGQYLPRQRGLVGRKEVELGTGHTASLPWLTSLETPVTVLQLTGALVGPDGRAIRIGSEGFLARRTALLISAIGGQALLDDDDVAKARSMRRDDLPGAPIAWQVALRQLVGQLTGRPELKS